MAESSPPRGPARETRLLLLTLLVSVAVLFLLARFRFPERPLTDLSPPQPLSRLTRGLALDELSASLTDLLRRFEPSMVLLRVASGTPGSGTAPGAVRLVPGLRVRDDLVLAPLDVDDRPIGIGDGSAFAGSATGVDAAAPGGADANRTSGQATPNAASDALGGAAADRTPASPLPPFPASIALVSGGAAAGSATSMPLPANALVARDEPRGLGLVRVPARSAPVLSVPAQGSEPFDVPGFVAVLEASPGGPTIRAEFISSLARVPFPGWDTPALIAAGLRQTQRGALLFSLSGRFVGIALDQTGGTAVIATGDAVLAQVERLARGESLRVARPGFEVQPLTPALARATGATAGGVIVTTIAAPGPDAPPIALGDVVTAVDEQPVRSVMDWHRALQRAAARLPSSSTARGATAATTGAATVGTTPGSAATTPANGSAATMKVDVVRFGQTMRLTVAISGRDARERTGDGAANDGTASGSGSANATTAAPGSAGATLGATFRAATGGGLDVVSVVPGAPAARAGLRAGDRITALLPARGVLTTARVASAFAALRPGGALVLAVDRPDGAAVIAVDRP